MFIVSYSQEEKTIQFEDNNEWIDTLNRNTIGLNVFPAFGMLGGGMIPNTKIFLQYKRYYDKMNLRTSLNFTNYYRPIDKLDVIGFYRDTLFTETENFVRDTMILRKFTNEIFSYDARIGLEAAFPRENMRLHFGGGLIAGYQYVGENYFHIKKRVDSLPAERINYALTGMEMGHIKTHFMKLGFDITVGVDINVSPNVVFTIQLAPELAYYKSFKEEKHDPDNYFINPISDKWIFTPDYIDFIISIRF